jgi:hypothetical protein
VAATKRKSLPPYERTQFYDFDWQRHLLDIRKINSDLNEVEFLEAVI